MEKSVWPPFKKIILAIFIIGLSFFIFQAVSAGSSMVRGKAWWGGLGYVYFNCLDDVIGDRLDVQYNLCGGDGNKTEQECVPPDYAYHFFSAGCSNLVHGVYIDDSGKLSGSAWNLYKGLISFEATTTPDAAVPSRSMLSAPCPACFADSNCWACYNEADQKLYGWGRSTVDGNWVRLDSTETPPVQMKNWNSASSTNPFYDLMPGDFTGTASSTLGALSFNCLSESSGFSNCDNRKYKVYVSNLQVGYMSAPNWGYSEACVGGARKAVLKWYLKSGVQPDEDYGNLDQIAYRVIVNTVNSTSSPVYDSGKVYGSAKQLICPGPACLWTPAYDTNYYWWLQLWDVADQPTELYQYRYNSISDTDGNSDGNVQTFTTYKHEFPSPFMTWTPYDVSESVGTPIEFSSYSATTSSRFYTSASPATPIDCTTPGCEYLWTVANNDGTVISNPTGATTSITFMNAATNTVVTLRITDTDGYYCSRNEEMSVNYGLPLWREVKAQ